MLAVQVLMVRDIDIPAEPASAPEQTYRKMQMQNNKAFGSGQ
jgi:hypothetical protein